ncbi:hypothetical protein EXIGLDRAFT_365497 [Exidia glandulosa HHB12029]|uniref:Uncharacterized protein n=1 Tax=Exidia glandulosa HHB12029 TaxID=1314781 RepID=A0A165C3P6_EXIGL|nr:hypothetical protein EXIGLDRAFT_365497 [Exidia glandulosa HHB12029]
MCFRAAHANALRRFARAPCTLRIAVASVRRSSPSHFTAVYIAAYSLPPTDARSVEFHGYLKARMRRAACRTTTTPRPGETVYPCPDGLVLSLSMFQVRPRRVLLLVSRHSYSSVVYFSSHYHHFSSSCTSACSFLISFLFAASQFPSLEP